MKFQKSKFFSNVLTCCLALLMPVLIFAQQKTVTGNVTDESGLPLPGATVVVEGTSRGVATDFDGNFSVEASQGEVLVVTYVGYADQRVTVGSQDSYTINLFTGNDLDEVVVTALGIQRQKRSLGYGTDIIKSEELIQARESNIINSLQGKITGVSITSTGGNLGSSSKIIIRGVSSLSGRNNPIWVVDGVIINDSQIPGNGSRISGTRDFANGAAVLNPDDVESINVLKGAAATALYGSRAAGRCDYCYFKERKKRRCECKFQFFFPV